MTVPAPALRLRRLERLRDGALPGSVVAYGPGIPSPADPARPPDAVPTSVERARRLAAGVGGHVIAAASGAVVVVETRAPLPAALERLADLPEPLGAGQTIICLDTETTGLGTAAGTLPFLVALGRWQGTDFVVRQLLLPDHPDERALLEVLDQHLPRDSALVTYNGRGFDWPLVSSRYRLHGRPPPTPAAHLDLLPVARQVWRHRLPDARLGSVESVCGVRRHEDLPGALIPERYFCWLRTGDPALFRDVLEHNRQDVVSLALLLRLLAEEVLPASTGRAAGMADTGAVQPHDVAGLGRLYARRGRLPEALACYDRALERMTEPWRDQGSQTAVAAERARTLGRMGRRAEAASAWEAVAMEGGPLAAMAWIKVAMAREHADRDPVGALRAARQADTLAFRGRFLGQPQPVVERDLLRRMPRLRRLVQAAGSDRVAARRETEAQARTIPESVSRVRSTSPAVV